MELILDHTMRKMFRYMSTTIVDPVGVSIGNKMYDDTESATGLAECLSLGCNSSSIAKRMYDSVILMEIQCNYTDGKDKVKIAKATETTG